MRVVWNFGEGEKLYQSEKIGSQYHFHHVRKQPNGIMQRVFGATEFKCGEEYYMKHFGKKTPADSTRVWAGA